jgi:polar amino acid transport system substrate-binding protein
MKQLVVGICCCLVGLAQAAPELHFGEEGNWPPFTISKEGETRDGLSYALISEIGRRAGFNVKLTLFPQKRLEFELGQGGLDGVTVISRNPEREAYLDYGEPLFQKIGYVYFRAGSVREWHDFADFKGLTIGVTRGHNLGEAFAQAVAKDKLVVDEGGSDEQNFMKLIAGRVDVVFANHWTALYLLRQPRFAGLIERAKKPYFSKDYHVAVAKKSKNGRAMLPAINKAVKAMKADGTLDALLVEHLNPDRNKP